MKKWMLIVAGGILIVVFVWGAVLLGGIHRESPIRTVVVYEDGRRRIVKDILVYPLMEPNDVNGIWLEYVIEKEISFHWLEGKMILRSEPFILSENPAVQGRYGRRIVYHVAQK